MAQQRIEHGIVPLIAEEADQRADHRVANAVDRREYRMRVLGLRRRFTDPDELLDGPEGLGEQRRRGAADVPDAEGEDEAVEFGGAARVDRGKQFVQALIGALFSRQHLLARLA